MSINLLYIDAVIWYLQIFTGFLILNFERRWLAGKTGHIGSQSYQIKQISKWVSKD